MAGLETSGPDERRWRARRRAALLVWAVLAGVIWNVVFDAAVTEAGRDYLTRQAVHQKGEGPAVTIPEIMGAGITRGVRLATLAGGGVAMLGGAAVWLITRRRRRSAPLPASSE